MNEDLKTEKEKAYNYAIYLLSLKLRTEGELRDKLNIKKYKDDIIELVVTQLKNDKYINDLKYAEVYVQNLKAYKYFGFYGIKKKLLEKKLTGNLIEKILKAHLSISEELVIAKKFLKKEKLETKIPSEEGVAHYQEFNQEGNKEKQKIMNRLRSRGFRSEVISRLIV